MSSQPTPPSISETVPQPLTSADVVTIVAHDMRNYLTPAFGRLQMIYRRAEEDRRGEDMRLAAYATQTLEHMHALITNLLDAARLERAIFQLAMQPCNLTLVVRQLAALLHSNSVPIQTHIDERVLVQGDTDRLRQVIHNLLSNAIQHSPPGAVVTLRLTVEAREEGWWAVLSVSDQGAGIPAHLLPQLFRPFAPGPGSHGLGLGLYLARHIAEAHGGTLSVSSAPSQGACFVLALPHVLNSQTACRE